VLASGTFCFDMWPLFLAVFDFGMSTATWASFSVGVWPLGLTFFGFDMSLSRLAFAS